MAETNEPRALGAALAGPAFATRGAGLAMHTANRHVERWAPETAAGTERSRPLRSLGFVDRLISPWVEAAQRSASLRMFSQYRSEGQPEGQGRAVSWVFPRPWYQDELDWMAAARRPVADDAAPDPGLFTTRGTYVAGSEASPMQTRAAMPAALYEYVAPSLSVAQASAQPAGVGYAGDAGPSALDRTAARQAYSPLVPLAAVQAAELMSRTVSRLPMTAQQTPALRSVLSTLLERSAVPQEHQPTRLAQYAPELVTPPAPREDASSSVERPASSLSNAEQVAERYAQQHVQIAELQRITRQSAERQQQQQQQIERQVEAARVAQPTTTAAPTAPVTPAPSSTQTQTERRADQVRIVEEARKAQADAQAQLEDRVARRVAERQSQRLHEQSRSEAATHARVEPQAAPAIVAPSETQTRAPAEAAPPEVAAAIASLPPELATMLARRPDRAVQTIAELDQAYRAVELMARSAASGATLEITRGPRLMMPSGLGGLVSAIDHAPVIGAAGGPMRPQAFDALLASSASAVAPTAEAQPFVRSPAPRAPMLPWVAPRQVAPTAIGPSSALGAAATARPAALGHVAWSDRWLARFAGASAQSLDTLSVMAGVDQPRVLGVAAAAPGAVFVSPSYDRFDAVRDAETVRFEPSGHAVVTPSQYAMSNAAMASAMPGVPGAMPMISSAPVASVPAAQKGAIERYDDDAETPDDVFQSISAAASQRRATPSVAAPIATPAAPPSPTFERSSIADSIVHAAPQAPSAGLAAQLASSPFAPALRHVLAIPSASSFDVRALFGGALSASYLAGLLAPQSHELELATRAMPSFQSMQSPWLASGDAGSERAVPGFDAAYVSPDANDADAGLAEARTVAESPAFAPAQHQPLTTLRSALLSWEGELVTSQAIAAAYGSQATGQSGDVARDSITAAGEIRARALAPTTARDLIGGMSLPMLGAEASEIRGGESWAAPGMIAERAHGWSVAQERSAADLSFDFVPPELVLAARVYGLGPAEAAQAARIAIAGPGQLAAMAGTVDRTFVQAMAFEAERRATASAGGGTSAGVAGRDAAVTAYPAGADLAIAGRTLPPTTIPGVVGSDAVASSQASYASIASSPSTTTFGVERRMPRGAFLWPPATVAALKLDAPAPDGQQSMSIAALELLAAQTVAELGTYAALGLDRADAAGADPSMSGMPGTSMSGTSMAGMPGVAMPGVAMTGVAQGAAMSGSPTSGAYGADAEPSESDVLQSAIAMVPMARRARFDALYLALGRSSTITSPAARAARALALAGRGEDAPISARERATSAWDVLPVVYAAELEAFANESGGSAGRSSPSSMSSSGMAAPSRSLAAMDMLAGRTSGGGRTSAPGGTRISESAARDLAANELSYVDGRPGLSMLSSRAGEALGSYVAPSAPVATSTPSSTRERETGAVLRAPTAAQEMVQTGRPSGRFGGGEVEIPTWFEAAARKMFEQQSGGMGGDISIAELTLISSAPSNQIAASTRGTPGAGPNAPGAAQHAEPKPHLQIDVEKIANEIYRQILAMMDSARARNGEPYL